VNAAARAAIHLYGVKKAIKNDPQHKAYTDLALTPVSDEEVNTFELFNQNDAARHAVQHERKVHDLTHSAESAVMHG
jgi:hypothetical protein